MPPKRRARKLATPLVVPPKKRKAVREIFPEARDEGKQIPEWLKVSIQILLINFHSEGVALLNSIQSEYETLYKDIKFEPKEYDFRDWESMLRSPQFKQHCHVYIEKKIPRVKGYPLPRSAGIRLNNCKWTIDPGIEQEMEPRRSENDPGPSKVSNCIGNTSDLEIETEVVVKPRAGKLSFKKLISVIEKPEVPKSESPKSDVQNPEQSKPSTPKPESPKLETPIPQPSKPNTWTPESLPPEAVKPDPLKPTDKSEETFGTKKPDEILKPSQAKVHMSQKYCFSVLPKKKRAFEHWNLETCSIKNDQVDNVTNNVPQITHPQPSKLIIPTPAHRNDASAYFRRTNVPQTWTRLQNDETDVINFSEEDYYNTDPEDYNMTDDDELMIDENPTDSAKSPDSDRFSNNSHPFTVQIDSDPDIIELPYPSNEEVRSRVQLPLQGNTNSIEDFNIISKNPNSYTPRHDPEVNIFDFEAIARIGTRHITNQTNFHNNFNHENSSQCLENAVVFTDWKFIPILMEEPEFCDINSVAKSFQANVLKGKTGDRETVVNLQDDPRLIPGLRKNRFATISRNDVTTFDMTKAVHAINESGDKASSPAARQTFDTLIHRYANNFKAEEGPNFSKVDSYPKLPLEPYNLPPLPPPPPPAPPLPLKTIASPDTDVLTVRQKFSLDKNVATSTVTFNSQNAIPQDNLDLKSLKFPELWKDTKWKRRFVADKTSADKFYNSSIYSRWKEVWRHHDMSKYRKDLIYELQKYEERQYPSRCEYFLRSALRMVEIDYMTDSQFSDPKDAQGQRVLKPDEVLYYVDFAGAPGGVIEFYNMKRRSSSKGFGVTYQKRSYNVYAIPDVVPEYFEAFYGKLNTLNGDGSLFCAETVHIFVTRIMEVTQGKGVHVVTTVGNVARVVFEDDNDEKWRYQHLAQIMVALRVLREGGNMAFKMYDIKSAFAAGLLYLIYRSFNHVEIAKLNIFAPSSGERVVICLGRRSNDDIQEIQRYLQECHKVMSDWYLKKETGSLGKMTIEELIPFAKLEKCEEFIDYLRDSNERLKRAQLEEFQLALKNLKVHGSIFSKGLYRAFVAKTTQVWGTGERPTRSLRNSRNPLEAFKDLKLQPDDACEAVETILNEYNLYTIFSSPKQWRFLPVGNQSKTRGFYMGVDGIPHFLNMKHKQWVPVRDQDFRLPSRTLVYAEIIYIFSEDRKVESEIFSIIDGVCLGGNDIRDLPYSQRIKECEKFSSIVTKVFFPKMTRITVTKALEFAKLPSVLMKVDTLSSSSPLTQLFLDKSLSSCHPEGMFVLPVEFVFSGGLSITGGKQRWFTPSGILFIETDNTNNVIDFCSSILSRVHWEWVADMDLPITKPINPDSPMDLEDVLQERIFPIGSVSAMKLSNFINRNA